MRAIERKREKEEDIAKWRTTNKKRTIPCPSVTTNYRNLKSEFPSVFRRLWWWWLYDAYYLLYYCILEYFKIKFKEMNVSVKILYK